jgi:hypothetical protein
MGAIDVHEFMTLDGVIGTPTFTLEFGFDTYDNGVVYLAYAPRA